MPVVEEMTSLFKVYKSNQILMGKKREIKFELAEHASDMQSEKQIRGKEPGIDRETETEQKHQDLIQQAQEEKDQIINQAKEKADEMIAEAREKSHTVLEEASAKGEKEGFDIGFEKGQQTGYEEMKTLIDEAASLKQDIIDQKIHMTQELEEKLIQLVIKSARRVLQAELQDNQELIFNLIEEGLKECNYTENLVIQVSEMDYDLVYAYKNRIYLMTDGIREIEVRSDPSMGQGSIMIETVSGHVDAGIETQIKQIESIFVDLLKGEG